MRFDVVTLFPELIQALLEYGIPRRAAEAGLVQLSTWNPREYTRDRHRTVDDRPYGGGPGMVMMVEPLQTAIRLARAASPGAKVIYLSPQGRPLDQAGAVELASRGAVILVAGRYEGIDERLMQSDIDEEWSIGDYVLSGGEVAAMALMDAVIRLLPGALGDADSAQQDSFTAGLLDHPHFTRPEEIDGHRVPEVLLSGNHADIARWRYKQALGRTHQRRPDLLTGQPLNEEQQGLLEEYLRESPETVTKTEPK